MSDEFTDKQKEKILRIIADFATTYDTSCMFGGDNPGIDKAVLEIKGLINWSV